MNSTIELTLPLANQNKFTVAQITDSHLFADVDAKHCGANVFQNLVRVLKSINTRQVDLIIFTGDLTQDHSEGSYQQFANAFSEAEVNIPCCYLAGNHDEPEHLARFLVEPPFNNAKMVTNDFWQLLLVNSKSETPAGFFNAKAHSEQFEQLSAKKRTFVFMHHHAIDVGYFIDRHNLKNPEVFWQSMEQLPNVKGIACGHVHNARELAYQCENGSHIPLFTCPATSIQFDPAVSGVGALPLGPGYRLFDFHATGDINTQAIFLEN